jgi:hypothetical protein
MIDHISFLGVARSHLDRHLAVLAERRLFPDHIVEDRCMVRFKRREICRHRRPSWWRPVPADNQSFRTSVQRFSSVAAEIINSDRAGRLGNAHRTGRRLTTLNSWVHALNRAARVWESISKATPVCAYWRVDKRAITAAVTRPRPARASAPRSARFRVTECRQWCELKSAPQIDANDRCWRKAAIPNVGCVRWGRATRSQ